MKNPWFKFYPTDWRSDSELRNCGPAARGLWIEMVCIMHNAVPYGHLLINGEMPTMMQLSMQTAIPESQVPDLLGELEKSGVFSRNGKGVIFSRKMVRDEKKSRTAEKNGKNGGNPSLCKDEGINPLVNPRDKPPDKGWDKPQKLEARNQNPEEENNYYSFSFSGEGFSGTVISLDGQNLNNLFQKYWNGNEGSFREWLTSRDNWYTNQPYKTQMNWLPQTVKRLMKLQADREGKSSGDFKHIGAFA